MSPQKLFTLNSLQKRLHVDSHDNEDDNCIYNDKNEGLH